MTSNPLSPADKKLVLRIFELAHEINTATPLGVTIFYFGTTHHMSLHIVPSKEAKAPDIYNADCYTEYRGYWRPSDQSAALSRVCDELETILASHRPQQEPPPESPPPPPRPARGAPKAPAILKHYQEALKDGPLMARELAAKITALSGTPVTATDVYNNLCVKKLVASKPAERGGRLVNLLSLP